MRISVINCEGSEDRWKNYTDKKHERWLGTHWNELPDGDLVGELVNADSEELENFFPASVLEIQKNGQLSQYKSTGT